MNQNSSIITNDKNLKDKTNEKFSTNYDNTDVVDTNISPSHKKTKEKALLSPKNDFVFQCLFSQNNADITKDFISDLLEEEIKSMKTNDTKDLFREYPEDKLGILDLEADVNDNEKVDIEVQLIKRDNFVDRLIFYISKLYTMQIKRGYDYNQSKRIVLIAIIDYDFDLTKEIKKMETKWQLREAENHNLILTDKIEICIMELNKSKRAYNLNKNDKKAQWMMFLNNPESKELTEIMENNKSIEKAKIEVVKMSEDEKMRKLADLREKAILDEKSSYNTGLHKGIAIGEERGEKRGEERGEKIGIMKVAKKLIASKMPFAQISEITGLTISEIEELAN